MSSVEMEVKIQTDNTEEVLKVAREAVIAGLVVIGIQANNYATLLCPVDTGRLRASISNDINEAELYAYIGTNVEYAKYVEEGTSRTAAQPFLKPAVERHVDEYRAIFEEYLTNA